MSNLQPPHSGPAPTGNPKADAKAAKAYAKAQRPFYQKKRYWLLAFVLLIVVISAVNGGGSGADETASGGGDTSSASDNSGSESNEPAEEKAEPAEEKAEPAEKPVKVEAKRLLKDFEENEATADGKYAGKTLQVSGEVNKVDTEIWDDEQYVVQVNGGGDWDFLTVNCNDQSQSDVASIKKGQDITVVGKFDDGGDLGVELKDCTIQ